MEVQVRSLGGMATVQVPDNATVGDVRRAAANQGISTDGLQMRSGGQSLEENRTVRDREVLVATPPKAKQGI